jgi:hypothetical protein
MAGSTGLEPATSGLTVSIRAPSPAITCRNHAVTVHLRVGAFRRVSVAVPGESAGEWRALRLTPWLLLWPDPHIARDGARLLQASTRRWKPSAGYQHANGGGALCICASGQHVEERVPRDIAADGPSHHAGGRTGQESGAADRRRPAADESSRWASTPEPRRAPAPCTRPETP